MTKFPAGTRVVLQDSVPWPERRGAEGVVVVDPNGPGVYPCDKTDPNRVVVLLDDDPLRPSGPWTWSCAVDRGDVRLT